MKRLIPLRRCLVSAAILMGAAPRALFACATCFGASDSDLARGMNWGILSLLAVVVVVLTGIASFFIYLVKRSAALAAAGARAPEISKASKP